MPFFLPFPIYITSVSSAKSTLLPELSLVWPLYSHYQIALIDDYSSIIDFKFEMAKYHTVTIFSIHYILYFAFCMK